jgi:hypothetical protein
MSKRPRDHPNTEAVRHPRRTPLYQEEERCITARRYTGSETVLSSTDALTARRGARRPPRLTLDPPLHLRACTATWWHALARSRGRPPANESGRLPPGGQAGHRPHSWTGYQIERLRNWGGYVGSVGGSRLARRSSASSSRCTTSSLRISSSRAWRAACQSESWTALTSSACASPCSPGVSPPRRPAGRPSACPSRRIPAVTKGQLRLVEDPP